MDDRPGPRKLAEVLKALSAESEMGEAENILTGLQSVDEALGGLRKGALYIVAGRPSMGKTSLMLRLVEQAALRQMKSVLLFASECSAVETAQAMLYAKAGVNRPSCRTEPLSSAESQRLAQADRAFQEADISIDDAAGISLGEMAQRVRSTDVDFVVVDGAHLLRLDSPVSLSASLKALARELDIPIAVTAPVHRRAEGRPRWRPILRDVYGVGNAEADADVIVVLWREEYYERASSAKGLCEAMVLKNRFGGTGSARIPFHAGSGRMG